MVKINELAKREDNQSLSIRPIISSKKRLKLKKIKKRRNKNIKFKNNKNRILIENNINESKKSLKYIKTNDFIIDGEKENNNIISKIQNKNKILCFNKYNNLKIQSQNETQIDSSISKNKINLFDPSKLFCHSENFFYISPINRDENLKCYIFPSTLSMYFEKDFENDFEIKNEINNKKNNEIYNEMYNENNNDVTPVNINDIPLLNFPIPEDPTINFINNRRSNNNESNNNLNNNVNNNNRNNNNNTSNNNINNNSINDFIFNNDYLYNNYLMNDLLFIDDYYNIFPNRRNIRNIKESLPKKKITKVVNLDDNKKNCIICLEDFKIGQNIYNLPCSHVFHVRCFNKELKIRQKCPICRVDLIE